MTKLRLSAAARTDLQEIREIGVREHGTAAAEAHLRGFRRWFQLLREYPLAGQERAEFERGIRSLSHRPHRILYQVAGDTVLIVRILHSSRDIRSALRETA
jgi:toxin ParE1/3/4